MNLLTIKKTETSLDFSGTLGKTSLDLQKYDPSGFLAVRLNENNEYVISSVNEENFRELNVNVVEKENATQIRQFLEVSSKKIKKSELSFNLNSVLNSLCKQKVQGVSRGFITYLRIFGVGYRVFFSKNILTLKLGFSHFVKIRIPNSIQIFLPEPTLICLYGLDKNEVTQIAATIQQIKPPSPYKGKGIRILDSSVRLKIGKKKS
jgi:large subunit ribosomal protein L6